ncbi:MAG: NAD(P)-dependent oxidoreductase [Candidatus Symbiodolus clandestinus]
MTTILVTGSNGLIGKTLCKRLHEADYTVRAIDNALPSSQADYGDITALDAIQQPLNDCHGIIHLAAVSRVIWGEQQPANCWCTNVLGTHALLEFAYNSPCKPWLIQASSREVYGQQSQFPVCESAPLQPLNTYAHTKVVAEKLVQYYQSRGLRAAILRFSSVYGRTDDHADRVLPAFCRAAVSGKPLTIEGRQHTFDFTHVCDVVEGILQTVIKLEQGQVLPPLHLTTGQPISLGELAELVCNTHKTRLPFIEAPPRNFDVAKFYGDPELAGLLLGWRPSIDLTAGVATLLDDFSREPATG